MSDYLDPANEELLKDFFVEAQMQVDLLEQNILILENNPHDRDAVDEIFRAAHTLKGAAATVQMLELSEFTHLVEDVLDRIRSDELSVDGDVVDTLLSAIDVIKAMLDERSQGGTFSGDVSETEKTLRTYLGKKPAAVTKPKKSTGSGTASRTPSPAAAPSNDTLTEYEILEMQNTAQDGEPIYRVRVHFDEDNPMNTVGGIQVFAALKAFGPVLKTVPEFDRLYEDTFFPIVDYYLATNENIQQVKDRITLPDVTTDVSIEMVSAGTSGAHAPRAEAVVESTAEEIAVLSRDDDSEPPIPVAETVQKQTGEAETRKQVATGSVLRVDSRRIDDLLNLVSETVITKATFNQVTSQFADNLTTLQNSQNILRDKLKELFDSLPEYLETM